MSGHVAIVGGGFTGFMLAVNLLGKSAARVTLIEREREHGLGVAYGAARPEHLLNVRASNMSAFADRPEHFAEWLASQGLADTGQMFAPRPLYGEYLKEIRDRALQSDGDRLRLIAGEVRDIEKRDGGVLLSFADGTRIEAEVAVLAVGNLPPLTLAPIAAADLPPGRYRPDPWAEDVAEGLGDGDTVLILGSGLTMVDQALLLESAGFRGRMVAISRRGLLPRSHAVPQPWARLEQPPSGPLSRMTGKLRARADEVGWRNAIDELRPFSQALWQGLTRDEQSRFLRHLRAWWDVHRHRIAPQVSDRIVALRRSGRLEVHAGRLRSVRERNGAADVEYMPRGASTPERLRVQRIVNCTGPATDIARTPDALLRALVERGTIRPDPLGIGIDVADKGRTLTIDGRPNDRLLSLGPMSRGAYWEIVAVPDIREQVADTAIAIARTMASPAAEPR